MRCNLRHDGSYPGGTPFWVSRGDPRGGQKKKLAMLIFLVSELGGLNLRCHRPIMVNVTLYAMRFAT